MKKYRLKQWYPSLQKKTIEGNIVNWDDDEKAYTVIQNGDRVEILDKTEVENNTDFWELIEEEKPLFTTADGVDIFLGHSYILIDKEFIKHKQTASNIVYTEYFKKFKHESNADEYILWNKPLLSLQEIDDTIEMYTHEFVELIKLAKERVEE